MLVNKTYEKELLNTDILIKFLNQNQYIDFLTFDLQDEDNLKKLNFNGLLKNRKKIVFLTKAFQRLIRIIPQQKPDIALSLLKAGIHSALQIAAMTRKDFMHRFVGILNNDEKIADRLYKNALEKRSAILIQYINILQNGEPHISAARFS